MDRDEFLSESTKGRGGLVREFFLYLNHNKKWWLAPIILFLLLFGLLLVLGGTPVGPFIYPLF
jgi:hypothetical protein